MPIIRTMLDGPAYTLDRRGELVLIGSPEYFQMRLSEVAECTPHSMGELANRLMKNGLRPFQAWKVVIEASEEDAIEAVSILAKFGSLCVTRRELMKIGWTGTRVHCALKIGAVLRLHRKLRLV